MSTVVARAPLKAGLRGLSEAEAKARRRAGQGNDVPVPQAGTYWQIFRRNAFSPLYATLIAVAALLLAFDLPLDALVTAGPIVVYVGVGVVQEVRAKQQLDRIALLVQPRVRLIRDGSARDADPAEVVIGDLLEAEAGDQLPLDGQIIDGEIEVDESLLTGESENVLRRPGERILSGSVVGAGRATYEAERVGLDSYANRLLLEARRYRDESTPLQRDVARAIAFIVGMVVLVSIPVAAAVVAGGESLTSAAGARAAAVMVSLVPQGLAMMIMITYTLGALRIAGRGALVQRLSAIEAMSRVDTLCLDKTGTLTSRRMELIEAVPLAGTDDSAPSLDAARLRELAGTMAASMAGTTPSLEALRHAVPQDAQPILEEVPFRSGRRWSAVTLGGEHPGSFVLGAPDRLIGEAGWADPLRTSVGDRVAALAESGLRVLLLARAPAGASFRDALGEACLPDRLEPLGLLALSEEIRPQAVATLRAFMEAGVELRVLSGDDPRTVGAVAAAVNLAPAAATANGDELAELDDTALGVAVGTAMVIGRVDPRLKARIVRALRSGGRFVAMIGDGVNDILALKEAQLGIAMGSGSSAARGVSDLILMRDDFDLLPSVVLEGRRIVVSMQATLYLLLARTGYLLLLLLVTSLLGLALPLTPRTNAALALTTVGIPIIVIALWVRPARAPRHFLRSTAAFAAPAAIAVLALSLPVYLLYQSSGVAVARTALTTITVFCGLGLISLLPGGGEAPQRGPAPGQSRLWALVAAMAALYGLILWVPLLRSVFELEPMGLADLGLMIGAAALWTAALHLIGRSRLRALPAALLRRVTRRAAR